MIERNVHHQGKVPSRTRQVAPTFSKFTGKWSAEFQTWRSHIDQDGEYIVTSCSSGALFETAEAALQAGDRALDALQETGKYPNMCEAW